MYTRGRTFRNVLFIFFRIHSGYLSFESYKRWSPVARQKKWKIKRAPTYLTIARGRIKKSAFSHLNSRWSSRRPKQGDFRSSTGSNSYFSDPAIFPYFFPPPMQNYLTALRSVHVWKHMAGIFVLFWLPIKLFLINRGFARDLKPWWVVGRWTVRLHFVW